MKATNAIFAVLAVVMAAAMLSGCLSMAVKVNRNGSCDVTYIIDVSRPQNNFSQNDAEKTAIECIDEINRRAGKNVARLKGVRENRNENKITVTISVSNINELGDGSFFGTVGQYRRAGGRGLENLTDADGKKACSGDIPDNLYLFYMPVSDNEPCEITEVSVNVPGRIKYLTEGAGLERKNVARFRDTALLVIFRKGETGLPVWIIPTAAIILIITFLIKRKPTTAAPVVSPPVTTGSTDSFIHHS